MAAVPRLLDKQLIQVVSLPTNREPVIYDTSGTTDLPSLAEWVDHGALASPS